jgi:hypothetical protein
LWTPAAWTTGGCCTSTHPPWSCWVSEEALACTPTYFLA